MLRRRLLARRTRQDQVSMMEHRFRVKDELDQILVDIQEISREHIAKMDSRISVLNQLLSEADRKIRQIESLLKRIESASTEKLSTVFMNPLHEKVLQYANQGMNVAQICSKTGLERGEVELVLSLHQITQRRP
jgi:predicted transcriptional regulator